MTKNFKKVLLTIASLGFLMTPALVPAMASAATLQQQIGSSVCSGTNANTNASGGGGDCGTHDANTQIGNLMKNIINLFSLFVGIVSVIMIIVGGFNFITSNGDTSKITSSRTTIVYALVGLVIVAMAQFIVHFVLGKLTNIT
jgi:cytochrome bd-type quinol oxidase subunit 2